MTEFHFFKERPPLKRTRTWAPLVPRFWLHLMSGLVWSAVGTGLMITASRWASQYEWPANLIWLTAGLITGIPVYAFGFSRLAERNIQRIEGRRDLNCLFAFQPWRSYLLIVLMMALGYGLRHSQLPRQLLVAIYAAVGSGLALSSSLYYEKLRTFFTS